MYIVCYLDLEMGMYIVCYLDLEMGIAKTLNPKPIIKTLELEGFFIIIIRLAS
jgi:hypothetical protein